MSREETPSIAGSEPNVPESSLVVNVDQIPDQDADIPRDPMGIFHDPKKFPASDLSPYIIEKRYINMPDPDFRNPLLASEEQLEVFKDFETGYISIDLPQPIGTLRTLDVFVLIPKNVLNGIASGGYPVHVRFHGGGFCTGSPAYAPWFTSHIRNLIMQHNAITLMPTYRKMPESHGDEILQDIDTFWNWFQGPKFPPDLEKLLVQKGGKLVAKERVKRYQLLVSGESAGGFLAAYSWLSQPSLKIRAVYMQYPMLKAYTRAAGNEYRGKIITEQQLQQYAEIYCTHIAELKKKGWVSPRTSSIPPHGMDMAYMLSSAKKEVIIDGKPVKMSCWAWWFRQPDILDRLREIIGASTQPAGQPPAKKMRHTTTKNATTSGSGSRAHSKSPAWKLPPFSLPPAEHTKPTYCPNIFISHGMDDTNCPIRDTEEFVSMVQQLYPHAQIQVEKVPKQAHGFDYNLDESEKGNEWLKALLEDIGSAWVSTTSAGDHSPTQQVIARDVGGKDSRGGSKRNTPES